MKEIINQIKSLVAGDLVCVDWNDASIGKSLINGLNGIDVPVKSYGVFVGVLGQKRKHVILAQNCFLYSDGLYDLDYVAVPVPWATGARVIVKGHMEAKAQSLLHSFLTTEKLKNEKPSSSRCRRQQRVRNHD